MILSEHLHSVEGVRRINSIYPKSSMSVLSFVLVILISSRLYILYFVIILITFFQVQLFLDFVRQTFNSYLKGQCFFQRSTRQKTPEVSQEKNSGFNWNIYAESKLIKNKLTYQIGFSWSVKNEKVDTGLLNRKNYLPFRNEISIFTQKQILLKHFTKTFLRK